jgi:hypothetical protein
MSTDRVDELIKLLLCRHVDEGRVSPLFPEEKVMKETAAVLAARHPKFNGQGLGFDIVGTADWPAVIRVGPGGRFLNEEAIEIFFGIPVSIAKRMCDEQPSQYLIDLLRTYGSAEASHGLN